MNLSDLEQINDITAKYEQQVARLTLLSSIGVKLTLTVKHGEAEFSLFSNPTSNKIKEISGLCDTSLDLLNSVVRNEAKARIRFYAAQLESLGVEVSTLTAVKAA